jgi:hypothetical protein
MSLKSILCSVVAASLVLVTQSVHAQRTNNDRQATGNSGLIIEGSTYIGGCNVGVRLVEGSYHCPPDNPDGGRTPANYFWDASSTAGYSMGQTSNPSKTGAFIKIAQTGQYCSGTSLVYTYNNGATVDQGYSASCVTQVAQYCVGTSMVISYNNGSIVDQGYNASCDVQIADAGGSSGGNGGESASGNGGVSDGQGQGVGTGEAGGLGGSDGATD